MKKSKKIIPTVTGIAATLAVPVCAQASHTATLSVATNADFPPYEYCEDQEIVGIDMEIARMIAEELGMDLEICNMSFDSIFESVESGKTQIAMGRIVKPEEDSETLSFSDGYMSVNYAIVTAQEYPEFQKEDLEGKKVGAADALHGASLAEELSPDHTVVYEKEEDAVEALEKGEVDALVLDEKAARYFCSQQEHLYICERISDEQNFVIAAGAEEEDLLADINDALATMDETGELDKIVEKYLGEENEEMEEAVTE